MIDLSDLKDVEVDPAGADGAGRRRLHLGRGRPRDGRARARHAERHHLDHRRRRPHARRRARSPHARLRPDDRQPARGRRRARRRPAGRARARRRIPTSSGRSAAAAATSASSPRSGSACTRWARSSAARRSGRSSRARRSSSAYREFLPAAPRELNGFFAFHTVPPGPPFPESIHLREVCGIVWCHLGSEEQARADMAPLMDVAARAAAARRARHAARPAPERLRRALPAGRAVVLARRLRQGRARRGRRACTRTSAPRCRR